MIAKLVVFKNKDLPLPTPSPSTPLSCIHFSDEKQNGANLVLACKFIVDFGRGTGNPNTLSAIKINVLVFSRVPMCFFLSRLEET